ncbi:mitochondrial large subunit ribosomal protein-domain-containing protein [Jimgerdemannia flammicorona]|uniref:Large ribosomal subunit protein mL49 n=1 Tax=Jimgerdemannia flammicorona TaxID=994334 RepID=A0A433CVZ1_9FUNG|nr:mitochondrial large subunit ribosomal protein-domain-containing protein [Jimgerdemannia flammicorona]
MAHHSKVHAPDLHANLHPTAHLIETMFRLTPSPSYLRFVTRVYSTAAGKSSNALVPALTSTSASSVQYPYFVSRTASHALPVYTDIRNGRTRHLTIIRRIEGDVNKLRKDLLELLPSPQLISVNELNNQIVIKGFWQYEVTAWLAKRGF